jgi:hypothetical protein
MRDAVSYPPRNPPLTEGGGKAPPLIRGIKELLVHAGA